ncbi:MAG: SPASM domain-containing protein [Chloroflexi bacterium]|nr:SPASM domain-containing protein [Chloroflexota bacterium]
MAEPVWKAILSELGAVSYAGSFAFHNYNEPLADPLILTKVAEARDALRSASLSMFTNGDYLNRDTFVKLAAAGIDHIRVNLYPAASSPFEEPTPERIIGYLDRALGIQISPSVVFLDQHLQAKLSLDNVTLHIMAPLVKYYHNRGGSVPIRELYEARSAPCYLPFLSAAIDYRGNLKLCCEIYDLALPRNRKYDLGNVSERGFLAVWFSERMNALREQVASGNFSDLPACKFCRYILDDRQLGVLKVI